MQLFEGRSCGAGERAGYGRVGDVVWAEGDLEEVVLGFAGGFVG